MKFILPALVLIGLTACGTPADEVAAAREEVGEAHADLAEAKTDAAQGVAEAQEAGAADIAAATADVAKAEQALRTKLEAMDAELVVLEKAAATPELKDEIVKIRARHNTIVVKVRDHDKDGISWSEIEADVNASVELLGKDIETAKVKVTEKK